MINFFNGSKLVQELDFEIENKVRIQGKIYERWIQKLSRSIACGVKEKRTIEKKVGLTQTQREDLESLVKGSIGIKGIASIESQIKSRIGSDITLECVINEKEEKEFEAPKCGRITICVYQLVREYELTIIDKRFLSFSKQAKKIHLIEYTDNLYDESPTTESDPDCGCKDPIDDSDDGLLCLLINKKYQLLTTYKELPEKVLLKSLNISLTEADIGRLTLGKLRIDSSLIPAHIMYLADIKEETVPVSLNTNANLAFSYEEKMLLNNTIFEQMISPQVGFKGVNFPGVYDPIQPITVFPHQTKGMWGPEFPYAGWITKMRQFGQQEQSQSDE
jgi:hypothetical protein